MCVVNLITVNCSLRLLWLASLLAMGGFQGGDDLNTSVCVILLLAVGMHRYGNNT